MAGIVALVLRDGKPVYEKAFGWRIDPSERLVMALMIQLMPNGSDIREAFPNLVYQALR